MLQVLFKPFCKESVFSENPAPWQVKSSWLSQSAATFSQNSRRSRRIIKQVVADVEERRRECFADDAEVPAELDTSPKVPKRQTKR